MKRFADGLWRALRSSKFFPTPDVIEDACEEIRKEGVNPRAAIEAENARIKHFHDNPDLYMSKEEVGDMFNELLTKFGGSR